MDSYRVVMIFKDPAEALVSRYFYNHCKNLRGADCGATPQDFPSLERYRRVNLKHTFSTDLFVFLRCL